MGGQKVAILTKQAQEELAERHDWWAEDRSYEQACRSYSGFVEEMIALDDYPQ